MIYTQRYAGSLEKGVLLRRYKRFLADVRTESGRLLTIHCANTGSMTNCAVTGSNVWFSRSANRKRKYAHTWELAENQSGDLIGVNTGLANHLVKEAIENGTIRELADFDEMHSEVGYGEEKSRIDLLLTSSLTSSMTSSTDNSCVNVNQSDAAANLHESEVAYSYVEVKSVTLLDDTAGAGIGYFPDAVSSRGSKHLRELMKVHQQGHRAVLCYCVQHTGIREVRPADHIDKVYGETLRQAMAAGVEVIAYGTSISPEEIFIKDALPVVCQDP